MERKDYSEKVREIKNEIIKEIRDILGYNTVHYFAKTFFVHYIDGEVATTEVCASVEVEKDGGVIFHVKYEGEPETEMITDEHVFFYDTDTFIDILDNLKREIRESKLSRLRELVIKNGGKLNFDGSFGFHSIVGDDHVAGVKSMIDCIEIDNTYQNRVYLDCNISGEYFEEYEENIPLDELDSIIAYVESQTKRKYNIKVSGSFSRHFEIEANSFEEALALAKEDWETNPLCFDDSNGEDWLDWTDYGNK